MFKGLRVRKLTGREVRELIAAGEKFVCFEDKDTGKLFRPKIRDSFTITIEGFESKFIEILQEEEPEETTTNTGRRIRA